MLCGPGAHARVGAEMYAYRIVTDDLKPMRSAIQGRGEFDDEL